MNIVLQQCMAGCEAQPQPHRMKQRFTQTGSRVEITIWNIPALLCPVCHQSYVEEGIAEQLSLLCRPFHGTQGAIPNLPPAKISIDFSKAAPTGSFSSGKSVMVYEGNTRS